MATLEDTVRAVVQDFINKEVLFTALDVSNAVKQELPHARHREVRDVVRSMFGTEIESQGWARTPISVTLEDGKTADALLYHPLTDSWDLDSKYDAQQRVKTPFRPVAAAQAAVLQALADNGASLSVANDGTIGLKASTPIVITAADITLDPATPAPTPLPTARTLWDSMFQKQPSLFPRK